VYAVRRERDVTWGMHDRMLTGKFDFMLLKKEVNKCRGIGRKPKI
jgi:hypothetical protein